MRLPPASPAHLISLINAVIPWTIKPSPERWCGVSPPVEGRGGRDSQRPRDPRFRRLALPAAPGPASSSDIRINAPPSRRRGSCRGSAGALSIPGDTQSQPDPGAVVPTSSVGRVSQTTAVHSRTPAFPRCTFPLGLLAPALPHALEVTNCSRLEEFPLFNILKLLLCLTKEANQEVFAQTLKLSGGRF